MRFLICCCFLTILFSACHSHETSVELKAAQEQYLVNLKAEEQANQLFDDLQQLSNSIQVQGRDLTEGEIEFLDQLEELDGEYQQWKKNLTEVPGVEAPGHEGHDHGTPPGSLTDQQYLDLQKSLSEAIKDILEKGNQAKKGVNDPTTGSI